MTRLLDYICRSEFSMFKKLQYDPTANPMNPKKMISRSFVSMNLVKPLFSGQKVMISIRGGKIKAKAELLKAPTREITAPRFGMAMEKTNVMKTKTVLVMYSATLLDFSD